MKKPLKSFRQTNLQNHDTTVHPEIQLVSKRMAFFCGYSKPLQQSDYRLHLQTGRTLPQRHPRTTLKSRALSWTPKDAIVQPWLAPEFHPKCIVLATVKRCRRNRQPLKSTGAAAGIIT
ncbi:hypothetical protein M758_5G117500 [Ceratodon purpureus]|nr:hypothetical protein M758_5G117500 [Ceratodon purpureus]